MSGIEIPPIIKTNEKKLKVFYSTAYDLKANTYFFYPIYSGSDVDSLVVETKIDFITFFYSTWSKMICSFMTTYNI